MSGRLVVLILLLVAAFGSPAQAQSADVSASRAWKWELSAYMLGAGMDGKTGVKPFIADVDESFSDIWSNLEFGFMGRARATRAAWSFGTDIIYMGLGGSSDQPNADVDVDQWAVELNVGYQLAPIFMSLVGARYNQLSATIDFQTIGRTRSGKVDWWDPVIGGILTLPLGERWNFQFHGDIGGFGVGSDLTWQAELLFNWFLSPRTSLMMGYRVISTDYDDNGFVYDVVSQGPQLGITLHF
jgi:hypothetical protein